MHYGMKNVIKSIQKDRLSFVNIKQYANSLLLYMLFTLHQHKLSPR